MSSDSSLHFASQAEADRYVVERQISSKRKLRMTPARQAYVEKMEQRRDSYAAPVYTLSDDVLAEVFKIGAQENGRVDIAFSLRVSHVVARWRRVALECPALWTALAIGIPECDITRRQTPLSDLLLRRSSPLPIQLLFTLPIYKGHGGQAPPPLHLPASVYNPLFERCETLTIFDPLSLQPGLWVHVEDVAPFTSLLKKLEITHVMFPSFSYVISTLRSLPSLCHLFLKSCGLHTLSATETPTVALDHLTSLCYIEGKKSTQTNEAMLLSKFLNLIDAPNLRDARFVLSVGLESMVNTSLPSPSNLSALRVLDFRQLFVSSQGIIKTLRDMPVLEVLTLGVSIHGGVPVDLPSHSPLLPSLVELEFHHWCDCVTHYAPRRVRPCACFDRLARCLVGETGTALKSFRVSPKLHEIFTGKTKAWIRERVPVTSGLRP